MESTSGMVLENVRITQVVKDELLRLVPVIQTHPNFRAGSVTYPDVFRLALSLGIEEIKRQYGGHEGSVDGGGGGNL